MRVETCISNAGYFLTGQCYSNVTGKHRRYKNYSKELLR